MNERAVLVATDSSYVMFAKGSQVVAWLLRRMWGHRRGFLKWGWRGGFQSVCVCADGSDGERKARVGTVWPWCSLGCGWGMRPQQGCYSIWGAVGTAPCEAPAFSTVVCRAARRGGREGREHGQEAGVGSPRRPLGPVQLFHPLLLPPAQALDTPVS